MSEFREIDKYNAFKPNEYNGVFEIVSGQVNNGIFYSAWTIASKFEDGKSVPVKRDNGLYRNIPVKIVLGERQKAIENVKWLLSQLEGNTAESAKPEPGSFGDPQIEIPF